MCNSQTLPRYDQVSSDVQTGLHASLYTYFVFMNSSIRGPFLPAHWPPQVKLAAVLCFWYVQHCARQVTMKMCRPGTGTLHHPAPRAAG
jgi:hypothetical protein